VINGMHHVAISTPDIERLHAFYRDALGFETVAILGWQPGTDVADKVTGLERSSARQIMMKCGNTYFELFEYLSPAAAPGDPDRRVCDHGITHLCMDVQDLDAEYERLTSLGMRFHCAPQVVGDGCRTTYGRDPDGNVVELQELNSRKHPIALPDFARSKGMRTLYTLVWLVKQKLDHILKIASDKVIARA